MNVNLRLILLTGGLLTGLALVAHSESASIAPDAGAVTASSASADTEVYMTLTRTPLKNETLPTTAETIGPEQFATWSAQTAGDVVAHLTSAQVQSVGGLGSLQNVKLRGSTTNEVAVLIDGRPMGGIAFGSSQDLSEIPVEEIDHVEVLRGGVSALYGPNAVGGVVNIITRRAVTQDQPVVSAGYDVGSYGRNIFRGSAGAKNGPLDIFAFGDVQSEDGFRVNSDASTVNGGGNVGLSMGKAGKLVFDGSVYQAEVGVPGQLSVDIPPNQYDNNIERQATSPNARQNTDTQVIRTAYELPLPLDSKMAVRLWDSQRDVKFKDPDSFQNSDRTEYSKGTETQFDLPLGLTLGGSYIDDRVDNTDHITPTSSFTRSVDEWSLFAQDLMRWKMFTLIPSGRFDHHGQFGDTANPRVQLQADATNWLRFSGSAARSFRAPTIDELYYPFTDFGSFGGPTDFQFQGNPDLQPETAWTYDAGFELHHEDMSFKATYFRANISNLIQSVNVFTPGTGGALDTFLSTTINVGSARRQGAEIQIDHTVNAYFKDAWNYTYLENLGVLPGAVDYVPLQYSPRHTVNYFATITPFKNWQWDHTVRYVDSRYTGNDNTGSKLGSMILWDMRLAYQWKQLQSYIQVKDVTDKRYEETLGYPLPGRTFIGGVTWKYN